MWLSVCAFAWITCTSGSREPAVSMVMALTRLPRRWRGGAGAARISCTSCAEERTVGGKIDLSSLFTAGDLKEVVRMKPYEKKDKWLSVTLSQSPVTPSMPVPRRYSWSLSRLNSRIICFFFLRALVSVSPQRDGTAFFPQYRFSLKIVFLLKNESYSVELHRLLMVSPVGPRIICFANFIYNCCAANVPLYVI